MHIRYFLFEMKAERGGRPGGDDAGDDVERLEEYGVCAFEDAC